MNIIQKDPVLIAAHQKLFSLSLSEAEIKKALWSIPEDKAPDIDGFNSGSTKLHG